jgi:hypothetical protein
VAARQQADHHSEHAGDQQHGVTMRAGLGWRSTVGSGRCVTSGRAGASSTAMPPSSMALRISPPMAIERGGRGSRPAMCAVA